MDDFGSIIKQGIESSGGTMDDEVQLTQEQIAEDLGQEKPIEETHQEPTFDIGTFNKKFSKEFDEETLIQTIERGTKYSEVETQLQELSTKYAEIEEVAKKGVNPLEWFANEDEYIRQQFLLKGKDKYSPESLNVLTKITPSSIDKMNGLDILKTDLIVSGDIEGGEAAAEELLMEKYGLETTNWEEIDQKTRNLIKLDSKQAKINLKSVFDGIELPRTVDFEQHRTQLKENWQTPLSELVKGIDKIKVADGIDFNVSDDMKVGLLEEAMNEVLSGRKIPTKETASDIAGAMRSKLLERNMDKVVAHIKSTVEAELKAQYRAKVENSEPINTSTGSGQADETKQSLDWLLKQ